MRLREVELQNIRSHVHTKVEFDEGITVFTGRTGAGKSTILMAIEYALFGSQSGISGKALLRRNAKLGKISLVFEEDGKEYKIVRALRRVGDSVTFDSNESGFYCDGRKITIMTRMQDLNAKVIDILGYPKNVNPRELFEALSYAKQDEIRNLIEMKPEMRQQYIDRILQIDKYQTVYDGMRELLSYLRLKLDSLRERTKEIDKLEKELGELIILLEQTRKEKEETIEKLKELVNERKKIEKEYSSISEKLKELEERKREYERNKTKLEMLKETIEKLKKEIESIKVERVEKPKTEEIRLKLTETEAELRSSERKLNELRAELENIRSLSGICPKCKQRVDEVHKDRLVRELMEEINSKEGKIKALKDSVMKLRNELRKEMEKEERYREYLLNVKRKDEKENRLRELNQELMSIKLVEVPEYEKVKEEFERISESRTKLLAEVSALNAKVSELGRKEEELTKLVEEKKRIIEEARTAVREAEKVSNLLSLLQRLREDIRKIREVVRLTFLEEFRQEFMRRFEEIRKYDEEYVVDIKENYEPVAYSGRQEVPISHLSGGEKTSVALAYRLALAKIAAEISNVRQAEILILDEPTTGFDREDIKTLPEVLRNLKSIPQIIIVTHEELLKEAADVLYEVTKDGYSQVKRIR